MASTEKAATIGPKPRYVTDAALTDQRAAERNAATEPTRASTEVGKPAGRSTGSTSLLKMVSRSGNAASCSATHVDRLTTNTSSRSGRTITSDNRAMSRARTTTEVAATLVAPTGVKAASSTASRRMAPREIAPRTAKPRSRARTHQRTGHHNPSTSTKASTAATPSRPGAIRALRPDSYPGVTEPTPTDRWPATQPALGNHHRTMSQSTPATSQTASAPSLGTPVQRARWNTTVQAASATTEPSINRSDQRTTRS